MRREGGDIKSIYEGLGSLRNFLGLCADLASVEHNWPSIAGEAIARRSRPSLYEEGVLFVTVENKLVQQDINFKKSAIIKEINSSTILKLKDIKTEISMSFKNSGRKEAYKRRRKTRFMDERPGLEPIKSEIMESYPGLGEEIAGAIARCRIQARKAPRK